jgi:amidase
MADASLIKQTANALVAGLKKGDLTPHDLLDALEARIGEVDGKVNALPTLCFDRARAHADEPHGQAARAARPAGRHAGADQGPRRRGRCALHARLADLCRSCAGGVRHPGQPPRSRRRHRLCQVEHAGVRGGREHLQRGVRRHAEPLEHYARSAAGSSGGAAVALATGMAWLAHGSDMGGSLRNPASFNSICGMRPSPGRVATSRGSKVDGNLGQEGPMARNVEDLALTVRRHVRRRTRRPCLQAAARNSLPRSGALWLEAEEGCVLPRSRHHARLTRRWRRSSKLPPAAFEDAGVIVEEAHPDLSEAHECFQVQRALAFATGHEAAAGCPSRQAQAGSDLEHRERPCPER